MCGKHLAAFLAAPPQHRAIPGAPTGGPARLVDKSPVALQCPVRPESFVHNNSATAISSMIEGTPPATLSTDVQSLWQTCVDRLAREIPQQQFNTSTPPPSRRSAEDTSGL